MSNLPVSTTGAAYQTPTEAVLDDVLFQVFYRQLGIVAMNFGVSDVYASAQFLAARGRGGTTTWVVPGRVFAWDGVYVTPGIPNSPAIDIWVFGGKTTQRNTVLVRKGFWSFYLFPQVTARRLALTTRIVGLITKAVG